MLDSGCIFMVELSRLPYGQVVGSEGINQMRMTLRISSLATGRIDEAATAMTGKAVGGTSLGGRSFRFKCVEFDISSRHPRRYVSRHFNTYLSLCFRRWGWRCKFGSHQLPDDF